MTRFFKSLQCSDLRCAGANRCCPDGLTDTAGALVLAVVDGLGVLFSVRAALEDVIGDTDEMFAELAPLVTSS